MAFYVGRTSSFIFAKTNIFSFKLSNIHFINSSDDVSLHAFSSLTISQRSLYWFHFCAGVPANTKTNYRLNGLDYPAVVYSSVNGYPGDQLTVDTLQWIKLNATLAVSNEEPLFSSVNMETALLGFRLDNMFNPLVALAAQLYNTKQFNGPIIFDCVLVNEGNYYNIHTGVFLKPISGIYFFSVTVSGLAHIMFNKIYCKLSVCACNDVSKARNKVSNRGSVIL